MDSLVWLLADCAPSPQQPCSVLCAPSPLAKLLQDLRPGVSLWPSLALVLLVRCMRISLFVHERDPLHPRAQHPQVLPHSTSVRRPAWRMLILE